MDAQRRFLEKIMQENFPDSLVKMPDVARRRNTIVKK